MVLEYFHKFSRQLFGAHFVALLNLVADAFEYCGQHDVVVPVVRHLARFDLHGQLSKDLLVEFLI